LALELQVDEVQLTRWHSDPEFAQEALQLFHRSLPSTAITLQKQLLRQAGGGSAKASELMLQVLGYLQRNDKLFVLHVGGGGNALLSGISEMSDDELDAEISRYFQLCYPSDLRLLQSKVVSQDPKIIDVEAEEVSASGADPTGSPDPGRMDESGP